jgi:hypothetical protein
VLPLREIIGTGRLAVVIMTRIVFRPSFYRRDGSIWSGFDDRADSAVGIRGQINIRRIGDRLNDRRIQSEIDMNQKLLAQLRRI